MYKNNRSDNKMNGTVTLEEAEQTSDTGGESFRIENSFAFVLKGFHANIFGKKKRKEKEISLESIGLENKEDKFIFFHPNYLIK